MLQKAVTPTREISVRLARAALGEIKADVIVHGGALVNVYSGEILDGVEIAVLDGRICYVGSSARHTRGDATAMIDARGAYVAPGLIDGHTHIAYYARPFENLQSFLSGGATSVVASCDELATVFGYRGMRFFLDEVARHPVRVYTLVSMAAPQDPQLCSTAGFSADEVADGLADPRVRGLGEIVSWLRLVEGDEEILGRIELARRNRQIVHGHTAGARDRKLCAIAALGVTSCHEAIHFDDAIERLRLGYWTMLREGSLRQDLEATLPPLIRAGVHLGRLILVTDSMSPDDVAELGYMDYVVRRAISLGLSPVQALQAVTLNPAVYSGLEHEIGGIAPGRFADMLLVEDLAQFQVREVLIGGKVRARNGEPTMPVAPVDAPRDMLHSLQIGRSITTDTFRIETRSARPLIRVMELVNQTITMERLVSMNGESGAVSVDDSDDMLKVAMFDRHGRYEAVSFGFLKGLGVRVGAIGLTTNLDENTLLIAGRDDGDMALCANALLESGGGMAIVEKEEILEKIEFPFGGIFSLAPWREVGRDLGAMQRRLKKMGSPFDKPIFALSFLPFVTLPALRITARGLVKVKRRKIVPLFAEEKVL